MVATVELPIRVQRTGPVHVQQAGDVQREKRFRRATVREPNRRMSPHQWEAVHHQIVIVRCGFKVAEDDCRLAGALGRVDALREVFEDRVPVELVILRSGAVLPVTSPAFAALAVTKS